MSSIGFDIGKSKGYDEKLTNASITAAGDISMTSGRDVTIVGGNVIGKTVDLDVGRDLTILSPQAQGWRDGFSFGLTVGWNPTEFGIRGSKEDGNKAWSSGSGIVTAQGIDIKVGKNTTLVGALLEATDGDIKIDTGTLTVADLKDTDQYTNVGGSIGLSGGKLGTVGFSYEKKDKQGETRTTLDAAGNLNVNRENPGNVPRTGHTICRSLKRQQGMDVGWLIRGWAVVGMCVFWLQPTAAKSERPGGCSGLSFLTAPQDQYIKTLVNRGRSGLRAGAFTSLRALRLPQSKFTRLINGFRGNSEPFLRLKCPSTPLAQNRPLIWPVLEVVISCSHIEYGKQ